MKKKGFLCAAMAIAAGAMWISGGQENRPVNSDRLTEEVMQDNDQQRSFASNLLDTTAKPQSLMMLADDGEAKELHGTGMRETHSSGVMMRREDGALINIVGTKPVPNPYK